MKLTKKKLQEIGFSSETHCRICSSVHRAVIDKMIFQKVASPRIIEWAFSINPDTGKTRMSGSKKGFGYSTLPNHKKKHLKIDNAMIVRAGESASLELYKKKVLEESTIAAIANVARDRLLDLISDDRTLFAIGDLVKISELELREKSIKSEEDLVKIQAAKIILESQKLNLFKLKHGDSSAESQTGEIDAIRKSITGIEGEIRELRGDTQERKLVGANVPRDG